MKLLKKFISDYPAVIAFLSGILVFIAVLEIQFLLTWICFALFFGIIQDKNFKEAPRLGFCLGLGMSLCGFFWMIPGAAQFTGSSYLYGFLVFVICSILLSCYWALISLGVVSLKLKLSSFWWSCLANGILVACIFIIGEYLLNLFVYDMPWFSFYSGYGLMNNLYAIQLATYFGLPVLSFPVIFINYITATIIQEKRYTGLVVPVCCVAGYLLVGYYILTDYERTYKASKAIKIAILSENTPPDIKWDDANGNILVKRLLDLDHEALRLKPDLALWSESAVPWTYQPDDDLVQELLKITSPAAITHILGINTASTENIVLNSAYCLLPDNTVAGRYDKRVLLKFIEKPSNGLIIPFLSSEGFYVKDGQKAVPLNTPFGKAGIFICNEATVSSSAADMVRNGAQYLLNLSNDGWFRDSFIVGLHFFNARLRAVETRKDVVVNSNNGISGLIKSSGRIEVAEQSEMPVAKVVSVRPNNYSMEHYNPMRLIYICLLLVVPIILLKLINPQFLLTKSNFL